MSKVCKWESHCWFPGFDHFTLVLYDINRGSGEDVIWEYVCTTFAMLLVWNYSQHREIRNNSRVNVITHCLLWSEGSLSLWRHALIWTSCMVPGKTAEVTATYTCPGKSIIHWNIFLQESRLTCVCSTCLPLRTSSFYRNILSNDCTRHSSVRNRVKEWHLSSRRLPVTSDIWQVTANLIACVLYYLCWDSPERSRGNHWCYQIHFASRKERIEEQVTFQKDGQSVP